MKLKEAKEKLSQLDSRVEVCDIVYTVGRVVMSTTGSC